jgi:hypothetical protein
MTGFETALSCELYPLRRALCRVAATLRHGQRRHPEDDGYRQPVAFHVARALVHLNKLTSGDTAEPHLEHAATRLLLALQARGSQPLFRVAAKAENPSEGHLRPARGHARKQPRC